MSRESLVELLAKVEAGEWDFRSDAPARQVFPYTSSSADDLGLTARAAFEGSLDAAKALHEAVLPGCRLQSLWQSNDDMRWAVDICSRGPAYPISRGVSGNPARAWLCAILKALIAEAES